MKLLNQYIGFLFNTFTINTYSLVALLMIVSSCEEWVKVEPPKTQLVGESIFASDQIATSALVGIYGQMMASPNSLFNGSLTLTAGLSSDELITAPTNSTYNEFYNNSLTSSNPAIESLWSTAYNYIYQANAVIEGLDKSIAVSPSVKAQLTGEAKFIRAMTNFYLVNLFGDIPLVLTTQYQVNSQIRRTPVTEVYAQIIADLKNAQELLSEEYITSERTRPNKLVATALLSRVYLFTKDWANAEMQSAAIVNASVYSIESDLTQVFLPASQEVIWQLMPVSPGINNTGDGFIFAQESGPPVYGSLSDEFMSSFEAGDLRKINWINSYTEEGDTFYFPYKYKVQTAQSLIEYYVTFRLAEQYLIRAEALMHLGKRTEAITVLDIIRQRAGLTLIVDTNPGATEKELVTAIEHERQIELFAEWGHRWLDVKRTGKGNTILSPLKDNWQSSDELYPIPLKQIQNDPNMHLDQNPGY